MKGSGRMDNPDTLIMYIRISVEDQTRHTGEKEESNSITNQRRLLKDYIEGTGGPMITLRQGILGHS